MKIDVLSSERLYENVLTQRGQELNESWFDIVSPEQTVQLTLIKSMITLSRLIGTYWSTREYRPKKLCKPELYNAKYRIL